MTTTLPTPVKVGAGEITEAVISVVWTSDAGTGIASGQLQVFPFSLGPVPDTGSITLPAVQTYSDGSVVSWSGTDEGAENPAPVLYINDAPLTDGHDDGAVDSADTPGDQAAPTVSAHGETSTASTDVLARVLGIGGLAIGVVALVLAFALRRQPAK